MSWLSWLVGVMLYVCLPLSLPLWLLPLLFVKARRAVGALLVKVVRDREVLLWRDTISDREVRAAIVIWLTVVPMLLGGGFLIVGLFLWIAFWAWHFDLHPWVTVLPGLVFAVPSVVLVISGYYWYFFRGPLTYDRLVRVVKEYHLMGLDAQLAWVGWITRIRLWLLKCFS